MFNARRSINLIICRNWSRGLKSRIGCGERDAKPCGWARLCCKMVWLKTVLEIMHPNQRPHDILKLRIKIYVMTVTCRFRLLWPINTSCFVQTWWFWARCMSCTLRKSLQFTVGAGVPWVNPLTLAVNPFLLFSYVFSLLAKTQQTKQNLYTYYLPQIQ